MRLAILSYGTRGDVQPYVVAARALRARGHDVWVAASEDARSFVESAGVPYRPLAGHARALLDSEEGQRLLASGSVVETARRMVAYTRARAATGSMRRWRPRARARPRSSARCSWRSASPVSASAPVRGC